MDKFIIQGGVRLSGEVTVGGAKNAALALMPATLLAGGTYRFSNIPRLRDIQTMTSLLRSMGVEVARTDGTLTINSSAVSKHEAPYAHVKKMRASIYVLGPLVARYGRAKVSLPGGCAWGPRPVDLHLESLRRLGASVELKRGYIVAEADRLKGAHIRFEVSSVGATGNALMAATLAKGTTVIENAAIEPEITALALFLESMGARVGGIGTSRVEIEGVDSLRTADASMIPDRIEAATFLSAAAITGGSVTLRQVIPEHLAAVTDKLQEAGCTIQAEENWIALSAPEALRPVDVTTAIYPGFPTDMQAQWIALMLRAKGRSVVTDAIYLDRFKHVPELVRLGAEIHVRNNMAFVLGGKQLAGTTVMSTDLRASASLILAGLVADGATEVLRVYHIDRGYEAIETKLGGLGAVIERVRSDEF